MTDRMRLLPCGQAVNSNLICASSAMRSGREQYFASGRRRPALQNSLWKRADNRDIIFYSFTAGCRREYTLRQQTQ